MKIDKDKKAKNAARMRKFYAENREMLQKKNKARYAKKQVYAPMVLMKSSKTFRGITMKFKKK